MMHNPAHPGVILQLDVLDPLNLSVSDAAQRLGLSRVTLSRVLNGAAGVSPNLALRLGHLGVGSADTWVRLQADYDRWQLMHKQGMKPHD